MSRNLGERGETGDEEEKLGMVSETFADGTTEVKGNEEEDTVKGGFRQTDFDDFPIPPRDATKQELEAYQKRRS